MTHLYGNLWFFSLKKNGLFDCECAFIVLINKKTKYCVPSQLFINQIKNMFLLIIVKKILLFNEFEIFLFQTHNILPIFSTHINTTQYICVLHVHNDTLHWLLYEINLNLRVFNKIFINTHTETYSYIRVQNRCNSFYLCSKWNTKNVFNLDRVYTHICAIIVIICYISFLCEYELKPGPIRYNEMQINVILYLSI